MMAAGALAGWIWIQGAVSENGVTGTFALCIAPDGRFAQVHTSPLPRAFGFDGARYWASDWRGGPWTLSLGDRDALRLETAVRLEFLGFPAADRTAGSFDLDERSGLPQVFTYRGSFGDTTSWRFEDLRDTPGGSWPHAIRTESVSGESRFETEQVLVTDRAVPGDPTRSCEEWIRPRPVTRARWSVPVEGTELQVSRAPTGHLLVRTEVNSDLQTSFILDSGAGALVLDSALVERVGAEPFGGLLAIGAGGAVESPLARLDRVSFGGVAVDGAVGVVLDLAPIGAALGSEIGGIVGFDLLRHALVEIDPEAPRVRVTRPGAVPDGSELTWHALLFDRDVPHVRGSYEGDREAIFVLDSGSGWPVIVHSPEVERQGLLNGRETRMPQAGLGAGVGGALGGVAGELAWIRLGTIEWRDVPALFSSATSGPLASATASGNLGAPLFQGRKLIFDYVNERVAFPQR